MFKKRERIQHRSTSIHQNTESTIYLHPPSKSALREYNPPISAGYSTFPFSYVLDAINVLYS